MSYSTTASRGVAEAGRRTMSARREAPVTTGNPFWDMMLSFGRASQQTLVGHAVSAAEHGTQHVAAVEVIPIGEEMLNVSTRLVAGDTTRVRRVVVETPVEREVLLREERVIVERRRPTAATATASQAILSDTAIEMSDTFQVVDVWKSVRVTEEVVLRREVTERTETVHETLRHDEVVVEQPRRIQGAERHAAHAPHTEPARLATDLGKAAAEPAKAMADAAGSAIPQKPSTQAVPPRAGGDVPDKGGSSRKG